MRLRAMAGVAVFGSVAVLGAAAPVAAKAEDPLTALKGVASPVEACDLLLGDEAFKDVASEGKVGPGDPFAVDVTWGSTGWDPAPVEVVGCTAVDGKFLAGPSTRVMNEDNDGLYVHEFVVPEGAKNGSTICEEGVVIGLSSGGEPRAERSGADCFSVVAASASKPAPAAPRQEAAAPPSAAATTAQIVAGPSLPAPAAVSPTAAAARAGAGAVAAAPDSLPRTGAGGRALAALAGLLFVLGGVAFAGSRPASAPE